MADPEKIASAPDIDDDGTEESRPAVSDVADPEPSEVSPVAHPLPSGVDSLVSDNDIIAPAAVAALEDATTQIDSAAQGGITTTQLHTDFSIPGLQQFGNTDPPSIPAHETASDVDSLFGADDDLSPSPTTTSEDDNEIVGRQLAPVAVMEPLGLLSPVMNQPLPRDFETAVEYSSSVVTIVTTDFDIETAQEEPVESGGTEEPEVSVSVSPTAVSSPPSNTTDKEYPGGSTTRRAGDNDDDEGLIDIYLARKRDEIERAVAEGECADEACRDALVFARHLRDEGVLVDAAAVSGEEGNRGGRGESIPTAYAVGKLSWLVRTAMDRSRSADVLVERIVTRYASAALHSNVMTRLEMGRWRVKFCADSETRRSICGEADRVLAAVCEARGADGQDEKLVEDEGERNFGEMRGAGEGRKFKAKRKKKRQRDLLSLYETTSAVDADGESVFTVHIYKRRRVSRG